MLAVSVYILIILVDEGQKPLHNLFIEQFQLLAPATCPSSKNRNATSRDKGHLPLKSWEKGRNIVIGEQTFLVEDKAFLRYVALVSSSFLFFVLLVILCRCRVHLYVHFSSLGLHLIKGNFRGDINMSHVLNHLVHPMFLWPAF